MLTQNSRLFLIVEPCLACTIQWLKTSWLVTIPHCGTVFGCYQLSAVALQVWNCLPPKKPSNQAHFAVTYTSQSLMRLRLQSLTKCCGYESDYSLKTSSQTTKTASSSTAAVVVVHDMTAGGCVVVSATWREQLDRTRSGVVVQLLPHSHTSLPTHPARPTSHAGQCLQA